MHVLDMMNVPAAAGDIILCVAGAVQQCKLPIKHTWEETEHTQCCSADEADVLLSRYAVPLIATNALVILVKLLFG